ncbi:MAG: YdcF family protein [Rhodospirillaceae bacterium]|nr:YdcF family protein [Rhodospirillaceae bacterium]
MRRRVKRPGGQFWVNVGLMALFVAGIWVIGLVRYADEVPATIKDANTKTDAIVVLTGGSGRVNEGLALLDRDLAGKLFISGVYRGLDVRKLLQLARRNTVGLEARIGIGNAINTTGNATETGEWARRQKIKSIRLVTAAYHMPRSLLEFRHVMPMVMIVPNPVFPEHVKQDQWWAWPGTASLMVSEYNKFLMAWVRHRAERLFSAPPN